MAKKRSLTNRTAEPQKFDDLKLINGIGPGVEKRLHGVGIFTYAQLAELSPADVAAAVTDLTGLSAERIIKQDWIGQARMLAEESIPTEAQSDVELQAGTRHGIASSTPVEPPAHIRHNHPAPFEGEAQKEVAPSEELYHTATFTLEFLLDKSNSVHRTHVVHVQSGRERSWAGWQSTQFEDFLSQSARLNITPGESVPPIVGESEYATTEVEESKQLSAVASKPRLEGTIYLRDLETIGAEPEGPRKILYHDQPFDVRLTLDLTELIVSQDTPLKYKASIFGKNRGGRSGQFVREAEGTLLPADRVTIDLEGNTLPQGTYQLAATVILALPTMKLTPKTGAIALIDGGLVQVY